MSEDTNQKILEIQKEIRETPYHKGTEHHIGKLKARLAKLKDELYINQLHSKGGGGKGFAIAHSGDASIALVGFPSVGKSTLLNALTNAKSKVAAYDFTTISVIPGMLFYDGAYIQIFDIPGLITGATVGRGRGKEVLAVCRSVDLIIAVIDAARPQQLQKIHTELYQAGIRLDQNAPQLTHTKKPSGGIIFHSNIKQNLDEATLVSIAQELGVRNAEITLKQKLTVDQFIDALSGNRAYLPSLVIFNKIDTITPDKFNKLKTNFPSAIFLSAETHQGLEAPKTAIWKSLKLIRVYLKHPDQKQPDYNSPLIMKPGQTLSDLAEKISHSLADEIKTAKISGPGAAFPDQKVPLSTLLQDQMIVTFQYPS